MEGKPRGALAVAEARLLPGFRALVGLVSERTGNMGGFSSNLHVDRSTLLGAAASGGHINPLSPGGDTSRRNEGKETR
jgi:hypothetical protein